MVMFAQYGLLLVLSLFLVFHLLVLLKIIPYTIVWGGRIESDKAMYRFVTISTLMNAFFLFIVAVQSGIFMFEFPKMIMTLILWAMAVLFAFNTLGNIVSKNKLEQRLFTPVTVLLTLFSLVLALTN